MKIKIYCGFPIQYFKQNEFTISSHCHAKFLMKVHEFIQAVMSLLCS